MPYTPDITNNTYRMNTFNMNTNTITKLVVGAIGIVALVVLGLTQVHADVLPLAGFIVSYGAAVVILAIAGSDNHRGKRLT